MKKVLFSLCFLVSSQFLFSQFSVLSIDNPDFDLNGINAVSSDGNRVFAIGEHGVVLVSSDGQNFSQKYLDPNHCISLWGATFDGKENFWASGGNGTLIKYSINTDELTRFNPIFAAYHFINGLSFWNENLGMAVGTDTLVLQYVAGEWSILPMSFPLPLHLGDVKMIGPNQAYILGTMSGLSCLYLYEHGSLNEVGRWHNNIYKFLGMRADTLILKGDCGIYKYYHHQLDTIINTSHGCFGAAYFVNQFWFSEVMATWHFDGITWSQVLNQRYSAFCKVDNGVLAFDEVGGISKITDYTADIFLADPLPVGGNKFTEVYNSAGSLVLKSYQEISTSNLAPGMYFLGNNGKCLKKIIKL